MKHFATILLIALLSLPVLAEEKLTYGTIILPSTIDVAVDRECNLWWSEIANVVEGDRSVYFETVCSVGHNLERCFRILPGEAAPDTEATLHIVCRKAEDRTVLSDVTTQLRFVSPISKEGKRNILMLGDSRTWQSFGGKNGTDSFSNFKKGGNKTITTEVKTLLDNSKGATFNFVGDGVSEADPKVRNCADSGGTMLYPLGKFNQAGGCVKYCEANGLAKGDKIDYVTIMFGVNDLSDWAENVIGQYDKSVAKVPGIVSNAKKLVDTVLEAYPQCKILMVIEPTTCAGQDGWGFWAGKQTYRHSMEEMEKAMKYLRQELLTAFDNNAYNSQVTMCSAGLWCDRLWGFPYLVLPTSARSSVKTTEVFQECVHPFDDGYRQIAEESTVPSNNWKANEQHSKEYRQGLPDSRQ